MVLEMMHCLVGLVKTLGRSYGAPNRLVVLLSNGDGTDSDGTFTLTQSDNPIQLDGVSRKSLDHDFNADGYTGHLFCY